MFPSNHDDRADLPETGGPLYERLAEHYRRVIASGALAPGDRMPSVRALMNQHRLSLATALQAFRRLEDDGWLLAKPRSGYFVRHRPTTKLATVLEPEIASLPKPAQYVGLHERISRVIERTQAYPDALNLGGASAVTELYPTAALQSRAMKILRHRPTLLTEAGEDGGEVEFRQAVARRALASGVAVSPDEVIVTTGGVEGVNLALRAVAQPGDTIAIESPAFFGLLQILESLGLRALEIPASPTTGLSLEALDIAFAAYENVKALVIVPNLQNPVGCIMPDGRKAELVKLCARHGVAVIEDDPYRELAGPADAAKPLKAWDRDGGVIYCPSLNKVLAPGMRLGWMCAGRWHNRVKMLKFAQSRHNAILPQLVAAEFIGSGAFDRHLHQLRERLRAQREATADAIARHFPAGTRLSPPPGGLFLWVGLPDGTQSDRLFEAALTRGIRIAPGSIFSNSNRFDAFMRLSCPKPFDPDMDRALHQLARLVEEIA
ncbi:MULTISPECIES: PLP-dependent aminotransferase family protein [unclassified Caballeronia]|uniref:aminotransferase-like domain-containing protein n=1 Tax=unclassified Caballeronia TaxID=2646786 RepID=UPI002856335A|nr:MULTISPECIES: PLP-dependent aminotransferase family protein [unclassified Caballeronia]MDR5752606.1 PLP-dependent aminotransferase family protein [Caballeronia sp. LZ024]MDR5841636.1 PLP-dependent aminotransferase family protein [Caballeronia sp. LZ031]